VAGDLTTGFAPGQGSGLGWVDPARTWWACSLLQRANNGGDIAGEMSAFIAMAAAAIEQ
jgi:hypothetical protein